MRLEIPLPELINGSSGRCFNEDEQQYVDAAARNQKSTTITLARGILLCQITSTFCSMPRHTKIEVIPEFDMPAHARAAVMSMEARYQKYMNLGDVEKSGAVSPSLDPQDELT
ncbi:family 20 glycosylhydrolase [Vibrio lentus]|nr:family 20 glycosylhydrolase [Vibrio lentus]